VISVLVVDDSVVIRRLITDALAHDAEIRVVGTASNGKIALEKIRELKPDLVTLDIEMPVLDGLETLRTLRRTDRRTKVVMFSTLTAAGAGATLDALAAGASDYVTKPANVGSVVESIRSVREQLIPRIHALCAGRAAPPAAAARPISGSAARTRPEILAVGCSTGGPDALAQVLRGLPADLPVPVVVVQHMPPVFTKMFAERLDRTSALAVEEAVTDTPLRPGHVYLAPGDAHLEVARAGTQVVTKLHQGPPENFCRPAVDVLFRSVARTYGGRALALVLTGMGHDGRDGCAALAPMGAEIVAQDEATSVVWGMPGAVAQAGLADTVLPLPEIAPYVLSRITGARLMEVAR
jgi:two-component system, chemotaxis family, protein-glutamate methylesterase/glutaminase